MRHYLILALLLITTGCGKVELTPPEDYSEHCPLQGWDSDAKAWKYLCTIPGEQQANNQWFSWVGPVPGQDVPQNCFTDDGKTCREME